MLKNNPPEKGRIWRESWIFLKYILELNNIDIQLIELHASYLAGPAPFSYWHPSPAEKRIHSSPAHPEVMAYLYYTENIDDKYCISSPEIDALPTPYGIKFNKKIINSSIVRFQSTISNLITTGIFDVLKKNNHTLICEIGSGFGGLAFHISRMLKKATYLLIDIPETLFIAGAYIIVNDPHAKIYIYDAKTFSKEFVAINYQNFDYMFIPNTALYKLEGIDIDLFINMMSFQEMPEGVVNDYLRFAYNNCSGFMYSSNASKHPANKQLATSVENIICKYFDVFPSPKIYNKLRFDSDRNDQKVFIGCSKKLGGLKEKRLDLHKSMDCYIKVLDGKTKISISEWGRCQKIERSGVMKRLMMKMRNRRLARSC